MQVGHIISLMQSGVDVAIVTAAGYPGQPEKFEERVAGLLAAFRKLRLPSDITDRHGSPHAAPVLVSCICPVWLRLSSMRLCPLRCTEVTSWHIARGCRYDGIKRCHHQCDITRCCGRK